MASKKLSLITICLTATFFVFAGCGSDGGGSPAAPPVDAAPPTPPTGLNASFSLSSLAVTLSWEPSASADNAAYVIRRGSSILEPVDLDEVVAAQTTYVDDDILNCGRELTYFLLAKDASGNLSAAASVVVDLEFPIDDDDPARLSE